MPNLKYCIPKPIRRIIRSLLTRAEKEKFYIKKSEKNRLRKLPTFVHTYTYLNGKKLEIPDPSGYLLCHKEIFQDEIYRFTAKRNDPFIIDCGANIGLSVIYFKHLYPEARLIAFEPDPNLFPILERNIATYQLSQVELIKKAVWCEKTELSFEPDGSLAGRITDENSKPGSKAMQVQTVRLRDYLDKPVDFLKIDIEGAEYEVIRDCADLLKNVEVLFLEYHSLVEKPQTLDEILRILQQAGFRYHLQDANHIMHPFIREERLWWMYDLQLNIFATRD